MEESGGKQSETHSLNCCYSDLRPTSNNSLLQKDISEKTGDRTGLSSEETSGRCSSRVLSPEEFDAKFGKYIDKNTSNLYATRYNSLIGSQFLKR